MAVSIRDIRSEWNGDNQIATFVVEKDGREPYGESEYHDGLFSDWDCGHMVTWSDDILTYDDMKSIGEQLDTWLLRKNGSVLCPTRVEDVCRVTTHSGKDALWFQVYKPGFDVFSTTELVEGNRSSWRDGSMSKFDGQPLTENDRRQIGAQLDALGSRTIRSQHSHTSRLKMPRWLAAKP